MQKTKKQFSFLVLFFVLMLPLFSSYRVSAQESEINQFISDHWEDDYFGEVRMEVGEETVEVDGKKDTYSNVFHHSEKQSKNIIQSEKNTQIQTYNSKNL